MIPKFGGKMEIKCLCLGSIGTNCYLLSTNKSAVVIDPGFHSDKTANFFESNCDKEKMILLTHAHFDHIGDAERLRNLYGAKIGIGVYDSDALADTHKNLAYLFGVDLKPFSADVTFGDLEEFMVGDLNFKVFHTPGHTVGGVCYLIGDVLFSGDTLFCSSIGRTDFPGGDFDALKQSVQRLYTFNGDIKVYSGHGMDTTIAYEKNHNPFIRG